MAVQTIEHGLAVKFQRAIKVLGTTKRHDRLKILNPAPGRRYRWLAKTRTSLYDGFSGMWQPITPNNHKGEMNALSQTFSKDGLIEMGDLYLGFQPEEQATLREDVLSYINFQNSRDIHYGESPGIAIVPEETELKQATYSSEVSGSNKEPEHPSIPEPVKKTVVTVERAIQRNDVKVPRRGRPKKPDVLRNMIENPSSES